MVRTRLHLASVKTKCWRTQPTGQKGENYGSCVKKNKRLKKEGRTLSVQFEDAGEEGTFAEEGK